MSSMHTSLHSTPDEMPHNEDSREAGRYERKRGEDRSRREARDPAHAVTNPATNAIRHATSPGAGLSKPPTMPLMPAIRPFTSTNNVTARPMMIPPMTADPGVKEVQSIVICDSGVNDPPAEAVERPAAIPLL